VAAKLTRLTHKIAIQLHLVAESYFICSSRSRWPVRKLLNTPSYVFILLLFHDSISDFYIASNVSMIMNGEKIIMWKETLTVCFKVSLLHSSVGTEENNRKFCQDSLYPH
jgi:hypothetical protein